MIATSAINNIFDYKRTFKGNNHWKTKS